MKRSHIIYIFFLLSAIGLSQGINGYANISAISGRTLTVTNVSETNDTFEDGEYVIVMQMQDDVIGTNTTNAATFGTIGSIQSAGLYEVGIISSHTESGSLPNSIVLSNNLVNTYNLNNSSRVQLISFRFMGTNYVTTSSISTSAWNGTIGGVTAMSVSSTFSLNHSISANGAGFAGGAVNTPQSYVTCVPGVYAEAVGYAYASKGDGIYRIASGTTTHTAARGKLANGGGGGNDTNAGGGGGSNYTAGGDGGNGWKPDNNGCSPSAGGFGGATLGSFISGSRVFMGGGGGGGHGNDGAGSAGGAGGGIIIIKTSTLITNSACTGATISANGVAANDGTNDGAGGGGAGGSIIFQVNTFSVSGSCPLRINGNGGNGGSSVTSGVHGGGGGGGQGVVIYSTAQPTTNMTTNTVPGNGGVSCSGCSTGGGSVGAGTTNSGIIPSGSGPLPVELIWFKVLPGQFDDVELSWSTAIEKYSDKFIIQRMNENREIKNLGEIDSKGNYSNYSFYDSDPMQGLNYYRLLQVDKDGSENYRGWQEISFERKFSTPVLDIYPNPKTKEQILVIDFIGQRQNEIDVELFDMTGRVLQTSTLMAHEKTNRFELQNGFLREGVYILKVNYRTGFLFKKLVISN